MIKRRCLTSEFDWKDYGGKHHESKYTKFIHSYYLVEKFGIDYRRAGMSTQICSNNLDRDEAIEQLKTQPYYLPAIEEDKLYICKKLSISSAEMEEIMRLPPKWYWDYPNDSRKLAFIYRLYRKLYKKEKLANF